MKAFENAKWIWDIPNTANKDEYVEFIKRVQLTAGKKTSLQRPWLLKQSLPSRQTACLVVLPSPAASASLMGKTRLLLPLMTRALQG